MKTNLVSSALITFLFAAIAGAGLFAQTQGSYVIDYGPNNPADPNGEDWIRERDNPNPIMQITLRRVEPGYDTLKSMSAYSFGSNTIPVAQVESFDLWLDVDGDGKVTAGDELLSSDDLVTFNYPSLPGWGQYEFENMNLDIDQVGVTLLFTLSLKVTVPQFKTFYMQLAGPKFANGATGVTGSGLPSTYHYTVSSFAGVDLWGSLAVPTATALQGSLGHPILQFNIAPEDDGGYTPTVTKFRCRGDASAGHTAVAADVTAVRLYRENYGANGVVDIHDDFLAAGATISGTFAWEFVLSAPILLTSGMNFLVVADIGTNPSGLNHVFRMTMTRSDVVNNGTLLAQGGVASVLEEAQTIKAPVATGLVMVNQPTNVGAGLSLGPVGGLRVEARNGGIVDTSFSSAVYAEVVSGPGNFTSQSVTAVQAAAGVAIFNTLAIGTVGNYTIRFVSDPIPATAPSSSFTVSHGLAYRVSIYTQPQDGEIGLPIPPPPVVHVLDLYDNLVLTFNGQVTANLAGNPGGGTLLNTQAVAVGGVATFPNLQINKAGAGYSLIFTSAGIAASGGSDYFAMAVGAPAQLVVTQQPASVAGGALIVPLPRVQV
ncbi:MAG: hypothetical protein IT462_10305, partial [Planctomycetes bacterium]|nr:hypothetical protein [Planctomycetota bacterium]